MDKLKQYCKIIQISQKKHERREIIYSMNVSSENGSLRSDRLNNYS